MEKLRTELDELMARVNSTLEDCESRDINIVETLRQAVVDHDRKRDQKNNQHQLR